MAVTIPVVGYIAFAVGYVMLLPSATGVSPWTVLGTLLAALGYLLMSLGAAAQVGAWMLLVFFIASVLNPVVTFTRHPYDVFAAVGFAALLAKADARLAQVAFLAYYLNVAYFKGYKATTRPVAAVQLVGAVLLVIAAVARLLEQNKGPKHTKPDDNDTQ